MSDLQLFDVPTATYRLDGGGMFGVVPKAMWGREYETDEDNRILLTTRMLLIRSGDRTIVVDPGIGDIWDEKFTERYCIEEPDYTLDDSLTKLDITCDDITDVVLTHLHFDHLGGCFTQREDGRLTLRFPSARHHVQQVQLFYGHDPSPKDDGSYIREHLDLLVQSRQLEQIQNDHQLMRGVSLFTVNGHTPGQQLLRISTGGRTWVYGGDLFPLEAHLRAPWIMAYDLDPLETMKAKQSVLEEHLSSDEWLILAHDPHVIGGPLDLSGRYPALASKVTASGKLKALTDTTT